jgi:hypothetical protein
VGASENALLEAWPAEIRAQFRSAFERVRLSRDAPLSPARDYFCFPLGGLVSLEAVARGGNAMEVAAIGCEGAIGFPLGSAEHAWPLIPVVRAGAPALRISRAALIDAFGQSLELQHVLLDYEARLLDQIARAALCHYAHSIQQRLSRWLLTAADRLGVISVEVTHQDLSSVLGVARPVLTTALSELRRADAIWISRGRILLSKRVMLEATACDCYARLKTGDPAGADDHPAASARVITATNDRHRGQTLD